MDTMTEMTLFFGGLLVMFLVGYLFWHVIFKSDW